MLCKKTTSARLSCILGKDGKNDMILRKKVLTVGIVVLLAAVLLLSLYYLFLSPKIYPVIESTSYRS
jgi:hypothetical protein